MRAFKATNPQATFAHFCDWYLPGEGEGKAADHSEGQLEGVLGSDRKSIVSDINGLETPTKAGLGPRLGLGSSKDVGAGIKASTRDRTELLDLLWRKCTPPCFAHEQRPLVSLMRPRPTEAALSSNPNHHPSPTDP